MSTDIQRLRRFLAEHDTGDDGPDRRPSESGAGESQVGDQLHDSPVLELPELLDHRPDIEPLGPNAWRLRTVFTPDDRHGIIRLGEVPGCWREDLAARLAGYGGNPGRVQLEDAVFFDTECLGLSIGAGNVAFLVGMAYFHGGELICDQLLLDDFDGEPYLLAEAGAVLAAHPVHVSFNGKSFDLPLLETRFRLSGTEPPVGRGHWDLLHTCRNLWARDLPNARLTTLERRVVGFERQDDLPSSLVPYYYRQYLTERRAGLLRPILTHNRWDLISLAVLTAITCQGVARSLEGRSKSGPQCDPYGLGRLLENWGREQAALTSYRRAVTGGDRGSAVRRRAAAAATRLFKRLDRYQEAEAFWQELAAEQGSPDVRPLVELAKYYEHRTGDLARALHVVEQALARLDRLRAAVHRNRKSVDDTAIPSERPVDETSVEGLLYRQARLQQKLGKDD